MIRQEIQNDLNIVIDEELSNTGPFTMQMNLIKFLNEVLELSPKKLNVIRIDYDDVSNIVKIMIPPDVKLEPLMNIKPDYIYFLYSENGKKIKKIDFAEFLDVCKICPEDVQYILQRMMLEII